jgi:cobalt-zinc-cadmium resistance protein CzcA
MLKSAELQYQKSANEKKTAFNPGYTQFSLHYGQYNSFYNDLAYQINQTFDLPQVYIAKKSVLNKQSEIANLSPRLIEIEIKKNIRQLWIQWMIGLKSKQILLQQDSMLNEWKRIAASQAQNGDITTLEYEIVENLKRNLQLQILQNESQLQKVYETIKIYAGQEVKLPDYPVDGELILESDTTHYRESPWITLLQSKQDVAKIQWKIQKNEWWPKLSLTYYNMSLRGEPNRDGTITTINDRFSSFQIGIGIPLIYHAQKNLVKASKLQSESIYAELEWQKKIWSNKILTTGIELNQWKQQKLTFESQSFPLVEKIKKQALILYGSSAITFQQFWQMINQSFELEKQYLDILKNYYTTYAEWLYLKGL